MEIAARQRRSDLLDPSHMGNSGSRYRIGQSAEITRVFDSDSVAAFAALSGDSNPIHLDAEYAKSTPFGARIAHGMLVAGMFSTIFGTLLPGTGVLYLGQTLTFKAPVFLGDSITARVELIHLRNDKPIATFSCVCTNQSEKVVIDGEAVLKLP